MVTTISIRVRRAAVIAGISAVAVLGTAGAAMASQDANGTLMPGAQVCTATQYASYQAKGFGTATGQLPAGGAKFKLLRNGVVVATLNSRANAATLQVLTSGGTFPGSGDYQMCANNTGSAPTSVTLNLKTDGEF
jgi:hypothetical protein